MSEINVTQQVNHVFSIANSLRGAYQADKYKDVIIPMTIIRRLECALEKTKNQVCTAFEEDSQTPDARLRAISGYAFYNTSRYTLEKLLAEPAHLKRNFKTYLEGFSPLIRQILSKESGLDFESQINKMDKNSRLAGVVRKFSELDLDPAHVSNHAMGYMFEEIIRRFSENAEAGDHYTPREIVRLLVRLGLAEGCEYLEQEGKNITVADVACGTGGMLSVASEELHERYPGKRIILFGQEVNEESHAICLSDMLVKGQDTNHVRFADTMKEDCFPNDRMLLQFVNPPFGQPWGGKDAATGVEAAVKAEHAKPEHISRFPAGLPGKGDMQLLFMQHIIHKMDSTHGRACVISNGSPLFSGGTSSGESQIRRWMLENDYIEAIIGLPGSLFYNTDIAIYVWVLSKNKRADRKGKVQLIDATQVWTPMRRSLGKKRRYISEEQIQEIIDLYHDFTDTERCRIFDSKEFLYHEYSVYQPLQRNYAITEERIADLAEGKFSDTMHSPAKLEELRMIDPADRDAKQNKDLAALEMAEPVFEELLRTLRENITEQTWQNSKEFIKHLRLILADLPDHRVKQTSDQTKKMLEKIAERLSVMDKSAPIQYDRQGKILLDLSTKDTEIVPLTDDIEDYMEREVRPYIPDAIWVDEENDKATKTGAEIPFTRYFYNYQQPESSEELLERFFNLEEELADILGALR